MAEVVKFFPLSKTAKKIGEILSHPPLKQQFAQNEVRKIVNTQLEINSCRNNNCLK